VITAVDTNVLMDIFRSNAPHHTQSQNWLRAAYDAGAIIVCHVVYAELVPSFDDRSLLDEALMGINAVTSPIDTSIAYQAGLRWMQYRRAGGPRTRIIADFLIGAHAMSAADVFLTRDRGFYSTYFPELNGAQVQ
jgi:predicted nucleic acid-binding protein